MCVCFLLISAPVPLCPGLSSSPTVCEFIHRKCRRALRVARLMRSDVASPASRELSMSGRSARGKQTVDKIFNTALPVHGSNTLEKPPLQKSKGRKNHLYNIFSLRPVAGWVYQTKGPKAPCWWGSNWVWWQGWSGFIFAEWLMDFKPSFSIFHIGKLALFRLKVHKCVMTFSSLGADTITEYPSLHLLFLRKYYLFFLGCTFFGFAFLCPASI